MEWDLRCAKGSPPTPEQDCCGGYDVRVVDVFGESDYLCIAPPCLTINSDSQLMQLNVLGSDAFIGCALIRQGVVPSAPGKPSVGVTTRALELYRLAHFRCPQLSVSAFVKALSDIHSVCHGHFCYVVQRLCQPLLCYP
jgi:hypothetical protein